MVLVKHYSVYRLTTVVHHFVSSLSFRLLLAHTLSWPMEGKLLYYNKQTSKQASKHIQTNKNKMDQVVNERSKPRMNNNNNNNNNKNNNYEKENKRRNYK